MNSIVIARYNESLDWIVNIPPEFEVFIYNKGDKIVAPHLLQKAHHIINRPNTGREAETYLFHMQTSLNATNTFTVFAQGDPFEHSPDFLQILSKWREWDDLQPMTWQWRGDSGVPPKFILDDYAKNHQGHLRIRPERFSLATWAPSGFFDTGAFGTGRDYRKIHGDLPEGINVAAHFLRMCRLNSLADKAEAATFGVFCYGAIFAVRNDLVRSIAPESLKLLYAASNGAATYGYVLERIWLHLFGAEFETTSSRRVITADQQSPRTVQHDLPKAAASATAAAPAAPQRQMPANASEQASSILVAQQALSATAAILKDVRGVARPKRLFISTGYFATTVAATIGSHRSANSEDHLLIVIDRQDAEGNKRWAYHMFDRWESVCIITHDQYYEDRSNFRNSFGVDFEEVYSPHLTMAGHVKEKFPARRYFFYEEGITSYAHARELRSEGIRFYALAPKLLRSSSVLSSPVDVAVLTQKLEASVNCYEIPRLDDARNVILLAAGLPPDYSGSQNDSLSACAPAAEALVAAGFKVWLRPHPRVDVSRVFASSSMAAAGVRLLETDSPLIEPVILRNRDRVSAVVSVYSSYLIHSYPLFGIPAFSLPGRMLDEQQARWKTIQDSTVPDIQQLLLAKADGISVVEATVENSTLGNGEFSQRRAFN